MIYKIIFTFFWDVGTSSEELLMSHSIYVYLAFSHINGCFRDVTNRCCAAAPRFLFPIRNHWPVLQFLPSLRVDPILHSIMR